MKLSFGNLVGLTVVLTVVAFWVYARQDIGTTVGGGGEEFLPELAEQMNAIERLTVDTAGESLSLVRKDGEWFVSNWGDYPARFEDVKEVIYGAATLTVDSPKTSKPERWADLGVEEPGEGSSSVRLRMSLPNGGDVADFVVGRPKGRTGVYVRRTGEDQTWLVDGRLSPPRRASGWVETEILTLDTNRVARVVVRHPDGEMLTLRRTGEGSSDWELMELGFGSELRSPGLLSSLAGSIARLDLESVAKPGDLDASTPDWMTTRFETDDGLAIDVRTAEVDGTVYARLSASTIPIADALAAPVLDPESPESEDGTPPETPRTAEDAAAEAADLQAEIARWTYVIPSWKADAMRKRLADLVQEELPDDAAESGILDLMGSEDG